MEGPNLKFVNPPEESGEEKEVREKKEIQAALKKAQEIRVFIGAKFGTLPEKSLNTNRFVKEEYPLDYIKNAINSSSEKDWDEDPVLYVLLCDKLDDLLNKTKEKPEDRG